MKLFSPLLHNVRLIEIGDELLNAILINEFILSQL
jgi:hypothetical protein